MLATSSTPLNYSSNSTNEKPISNETNLVNISDIALGPALNEVCYIRNIYRILRKHQSELEDNDLYIKLLKATSPYPAHLFITLVQEIPLTKPCFYQAKILEWIESIVYSSQMIEILWNTTHHPSNAMHDRRAQSIIINEDILKCLVSLPDRVANAIHPRCLRKLSNPCYVKRLSECILLVLEKIYSCMQSKNTGASLEFLGRLIGRLVLVGHASPLLESIVKSKIEVAKNDFLWRRLMQTLFGDIPQSALQCVLITLFENLSRPEQVIYFLRPIHSNKKLHYLVTNKFLLAKPFKNLIAVNNLVGFLSTQPEIFNDIFVFALQGWGDSSAVKLREPLLQYYITQTILVFPLHLPASKAFSQETFNALRTALLRGVEIHLSHSLSSVRTYGMVVGEVLSKIIDPNTPHLNFTYEKSEEIQRLLSIHTQLNNVIKDGSNTIESKTDLHLQSNAKDDVYNRERLPNFKELDSDDDDDENRPKPRYIRDCLRGLIKDDKIEWKEACLEMVESLIRAQPLDLPEVAVELSQILLHIENTEAIANFSKYREQALVALLVKIPHQVATYLTAQFYDSNLNHKQRLDILMVLSLAAKELSSVNIIPSLGHCPTPAQFANRKQNIKPNACYFYSKKHVQIHSQKNEFSYVAGYFFFPLINHYKKDDISYYIYGEDSFVLGQLVSYLTFILHCTVNCPIAGKMGREMLNFVIDLQSHPDLHIRRALIVAVSVILEVVPSSFLYEYLMTEFLEVQTWLEKIVKHEPDQETQQSALSTLHKMMGILKQQINCLDLIK